MKAALRVFLCSIAYCLLAGALASSANAGVYTVSSCHFRDGRPAPTDLWRVVGPQTGVNYDLSCTDGTGVGVRVTATQAHPIGYAAGIEMRAPAGLVITRAAVQDQKWGAWGSGWSLAAGYFGSDAGAANWEGVNICTACKGELADWHDEFVSDGDRDRQSFGPGVECSVYSNMPCPSGVVAATYATGVELTVSDGSAPAFTAPPSGSLLDPRSSAAVRTLRYGAADRGSGVRAAAVQVDGQTVANSNFERILATCALPYGTFVPCPSRVSDEFNVDTSQFTPGRHNGRLLVWDASDGIPLTYDFQFMAPGPPTSASACVRGTALSARLSHKSVRYGAQRIRFTVDPPSERAGLLVMEDRDGAFSLLGPARRHGAGYIARFAIRAPTRLRIIAPIAGGAAYACSRAIPLRVRAGLRLSVTPRKVLNGQTIRFRGRLMGGSGAGNRLVEIQARARGGPRRWTLVRTLRTTRAGRFRTQYTFQRTHQRVLFEFRAVRKASDDFPYASGASPRRLVLVRG
jgi:hypothetical protein